MEGEAGEQEAEIKSHREHDAGGRDVKLGQWRLAKEYRCEERHGGEAS
jgi:hypothetical protein